MAETSDAMRSVQILAASMIGALVLFIFGDIVKDLAFPDGGFGAELVDYSPLILIALGFFGAFNTYMD